MILPRRNNESKNTPKYKQKRYENRLGMTMAMIAIILVAIAVGVNSHSLKIKQQKLIERELELQQQIDNEKARTEELNELEKYSKTKKFAEEIAKDKLGLIYENQIIFKENE